MHISGRRTIEPFSTFLASISKTCFVAGGVSVQGATLQKSFPTNGAQMVPHSRVRH